MTTDIPTPAWNQHEQPEDPIDIDGSNATSNVTAASAHHSVANSGTPNWPRQHSFTEGPIIFPEDLPVSEFITWWRENYEIRRIMKGVASNDVPPIGENAYSFAEEPRLDIITPALIREKGVDLQGINWNHLEASFDDAIALRKWRLSQYLTQKTSNAPLPTPIFTHSSAHTFSSFRTTFRPARGQWQLCNSLAAPSAASTFYSASTNLYRATPHSRDPTLLLSTAHDPLTSYSTQSTIRAIAASHNILIAGTWSGTYHLTPMTAPLSQRFHTAPLPAPSLASINHISLSTPRRSYHAQACISTNTPYLTILDTHTLTPKTQLIPWPSDCSTLDLPYSAPNIAANATSSSPDSRLRLIVGDYSTPLLTDADSGQYLASLPAHGDYAFAAAWAEDGVHCATAAQDGTVQVFDARRWDRPVLVLEGRGGGGVRSLEFAPREGRGLGTGKVLGLELLYAEGQDRIGIVEIEAAGRRHEGGKRQDWEFLGVVAGARFVGDGSGGFVVGVQDRDVGGLMKFERRSKKKSGMCEECEEDESMRERDEDEEIEDGSEWRWEEDETVLWY
ncbi:MAG: hypothetical protein MMC23_005610 [Stictis urceolatum]|nr:hypothetical protein [Stictis urceolata]